MAARESQIKQLSSQLVQRFESQHYEVEQNATAKGKSGGEHSFDILARKSHDFVTYTIAVGIIASDDNQEISLGEAFAFDDKCYDCGIQDKALIALPKLDSMATRFAQGQRIKVFDEESLKTLLSSPLPTPPAKEGPFNWQTKSQFLESLAKSGYNVEETAKVTGKSGAEYVFDILASLDDGLIAHKLGIDIITSNEVSLSQVSLFDTKTYDTGIYNKVMLISGEPTKEAEQFASQQRIKILRLGSQKGKTPVKEEASGETIVEAPGKAEALGLQNALEKVLAQVPEEKLFRRRSQPEALQLIPEAMARRFNAMPIAIMNNALQVAMADPTDIFALEALALQSRMRIEPVAASMKQIREAIDFNYKSFGQIEEQISRIPGTEPADVQTLIEASEDAPVASALRIIIDEASKARASDVHIEPDEDRLRIRYRIDGALQDVMSLPLKIHLPLTSRVKIMADMNIADHLRPQDGQFSIESKGKPLDVRVATSPTVRGETTVLRLLDKSLAVIDMAELGFSPHALAKYEDMLKVPFGMILISGPTGAGKTTTLYASVNRLDKISRNIITIEDPVEYHFANMNQIQVNARAGVTFASGLRSILRLDPDVILVGEIRDAETARIAVQSALTGHLVLSSIHANDAIGVIFRLLDLGIEPFLVSSAVIGVVAQRMVRRICPDCSTYSEASLVEQSAYADEMEEKRTEFLYGTGCELCSYTGYRGRTGLFEILRLSDRTRMQILNRASTAEIRQQAIEEGMVPLIKDGMLKVKDGITTVSEVLRNAYFTE
ncbi:MAG: type II/IV secretion system protein [Dehalococcoidia bacterium]|nr:type II/IV secretion system protein [Dehalococcoidia bacterium]